MQGSARWRRHGPLWKWWPMQIKGSAGACGSYPGPGLAARADPARSSDGTRRSARVVVARGSDESALMGSAGLMVGLSGPMDRHIGFLFL